MDVPVEDDPPWIWVASLFLQLAVRDVCSDDILRIANKSEYISILLNGQSYVNHVLQVINDFLARRLGTRRSDVFARVRVDIADNSGERGPSLSSRRWMHGIGTCKQIRISHNSKEAVCTVAHPTNMYPPIGGGGGARKRGERRYFSSGAWEGCAMMIWRVFGLALQKRWAGTHGWHTAWIYSACTRYTPRTYDTYCTVSAMVYTVPYTLRPPCKKRCTYRVLDTMVGTVPRRTGR